MVNWKDWCWSWNSSTLATSCEELSHWKRHWCWEGLGAGGEGDDRRWDGWMASPTRWTWVWVNSRSLWWTGRPGVLWFMGSQRVGHNWVTELNWRQIQLTFLGTWVIQFTHWEGRLLLKTDGNSYSGLRAQLWSGHRLNLSFSTVILDRFLNLCVSLCPGLWNIDNNGTFFSWGCSVGTTDPHSARVCGMLTTKWRRQVGFCLMELTCKKKKENKQSRLCLRPRGK